MKTTQKRDMGFSRILFLMVMLSLTAVFGLAAGGAPAGAGIPAAPAASTTTAVPAALTPSVYNEATVLAAFNAATNAAQVKGLFTAKVFAVFEEAQLQYYYAFDPANGILNDAALTSIATKVWNNGINYASLKALAEAIGSAAAPFIAG